MPTLLSGMVKIVSRNVEIFVWDRQNFYWFVFHVKFSRCLEPDSLFSPVIVLLHKGDTRRIQGKMHHCALEVLRKNNGSLVFT